MVDSDKLFYIQEGDQINRLGINVSTSLKTVIDLDERNHIIELKFQLTLEWFEYRATYQNLKTNKALNVLSSQELQEIWIPFIIFEVSTFYMIKWS